MTTNMTVTGNSVAKVEPKLSEVEQLKATIARLEAEAVTVTRTRGLSTMQVIRRTLARKQTATVAEIRRACEKAGVPAKSDSTIKTIMSDFRQTFEALQRAGRIAAVTAKEEPK